MRTRTLYRPVGPTELELIEKSGFQAFPPRLPEQPIFYPVLDEKYAAQIARCWNAPACGAGFVTRFEVNDEFLSRYEVRTVGSRQHREYWIPAEDLDDFNRNIVGEIEVIESYP
ncbi:MAG: ADP-ribosylation/crystallin [bacterium]|nr:ADP-ribosylation/crystallin [bacterium]